MDRAIAAAIEAIDAKIAMLQESRAALLRALGVDAPKRRGRPPGRKKAKRAGAKNSGAKRARRGENRDKVLAALSSRPKPVKVISARSGVPSPGVNAVLSALVQAGSAEKVGRGQYRKMGKTAAKK